MRKFISFIRLNRAYLLSLPRSLYLNLKLLPFNQAIKIPIFFSNRTFIKCKRYGLRITTKDLHAGMIKIGYQQSPYFIQQYSSICVEKGGIIDFEGYCHLGEGCRLIVKKNGKITFGMQFWSTGPIFIISHTSVTFEYHSILSWGITIMDSDLHNITSNHIIKNSPQSITIKSNAWIGFNSTLLKGSIIGVGSIVACNSVITRNTSSEDHVILAGNPAKLIDKDICWE